MALPLLLLYILPGIIASYRGHPRRGAIWLVDILGGWTGVGWIAALVWSSNQSLTGAQMRARLKKTADGIVLGRGLNNLKIEPEVSQIDTTHVVAVSKDVAVPALIVRRASTTIELRDGQSFMIGGLLQANNQNQVEQLPWLGSVPVLGTLFSSKSYQKNETDLAIVVTPHLVRPTRPGDVVKTPTDDSVPANDVDFFLMGKTDLTPKQSRAFSPLRPEIAAAGNRSYTGHMLDLPKGIADASIY